MQMYMNTLELPCILSGRLKFLTHLYGFACKFNIQAILFSSVLSRNSVLQCLLQRYNVNKHFYSGC